MQADSSPVRRAQLQQSNRVKDTDNKPKAVNHLQRALHQRQRAALHLCVPPSTTQTNPTKI